MATGELGYIDGQKRMEVVEGPWRLDADDFLLLAMLTDPIFCAELLFEDAKNHEYGGCYIVLDYQYKLFRPPPGYAAFPCARSVGKTESVKARSVSHAFRRRGEDLLLTAPELIHLEALTQHVEQRISEVRLTADFLKKDSQKSGFTHKPFQVDFADGTRIMGRIPRLSGTGVKGMHQPDLIVDEAQDYPPKGWTEVHEMTPLDAYVVTPGGRRMLRELKRGDLVIGLNGDATGIVGMSPVSEREVYEIELGDGAVVEADAEHQWLVTCNRYLREGKWQRRTTAQIAADLEKPGVAFGSLGQPWLLPDVGAVEHGGTGWPLPIDPYTLGVLLGDGSLTHALGLTVPPEKEAVRADCRLPGDDRFTERRSKRRCAEYGIVGGSTAAELERLGLKGCGSKRKFIPALYRYASIEDRLALLQGLVDTDGNIHRSGAVRYTTSSDALCGDTEALIRSLGGRVSRNRVHNRNHADGWCLHFRLPEGMAPARHRRGYRPATNDKMRRRIVAVRPTGRLAEMRCIQVADPQHVFLLDGYVPTSNTVMKDHTDSTGAPDFTYHLYGVHSGAAGGRFEALAESGEFQVHSVTALMRPGWNKQEKAAASAMYGGTHSPDYRRNILGEPGTALSQFFVTARLMACLDQDSESAYNTVEFKDQHLIAEDIDKMVGPGGDLTVLLDLPLLNGPVFAGMDVGLVNDPTVITLFTLSTDKEKRTRLKLVRMIHLWRFREKQIREVAYRIDLTYAKHLKAYGVDITGMGLPLLQAVEDDEAVPEHLKKIIRGYVFNAMVPVAVDEDYVSTVGDKMVDQYGNMVKVERDIWTGKDRYVSYMTMIEASTRYLRNWVDTGFLMLPFHQGLVKDMQGETEQRVRAMGAKHLRKKPSAFHMLDSMRAMAMAYKAGEVEETVMQGDHQPVMEKAPDLRPGIGGGMAVTGLPA